MQFLAQALLGITRVFIPNKIKTHESISNHGGEMKKGYIVLLLICTCLLVSACGPALVVNSAGDEPDTNLSDGICKTVNNNCTLRAAIMEANVSPNVSKITFKNVTTISPTTNLPPLTAGNTHIEGEGLIVIDGSQISTYPEIGIHILDSGYNIIQGLRIRNFLYGIYILADEGEAKNNIIGMLPSSIDGSDEHNVLVFNYIGLVIEGQHAFDNIISGNYIGVGSNGITAKPNDYDGVHIRDGAHHNLIGSLSGNTISEGGNLISGNGVGIKINNAVHNHISGNYIGTQESGNIELGNGDGIRVLFGANNNIIGLDLSGEGQPNLISGNNGDGIWIEDSDFTIIAGNYIGVTSTGTSALPNRFGIYLYGSGFNIIGTDGNGVNDTNEGNLISGNEYYGINISQNNSIQNIIAGNMIGTNFDGTAPIGNESTGITTSGHSTIIGTDGDGISDEIEGNLISGNGGWGVLLASNDNIVSGNIIGLDITGATALGNLGGIVINPDGSQNLIGTNGDGVSDELERNIISGNGGGQFVNKGIDIRGSENIIAGNYIGTDITGTVALSPGHDGIYIHTNANNNLIGTDSDGIADLSEGNLISGNGRFGIEILGGAFNKISGNLIGSDISGTIALPNGYTNPQFYYGAIRLGYGSNNNVIGTDGDGINDQIEGNVISGNAIKGIVILGSNNFNNVVAGNKIGTDISGGSVLGNTAGIDIIQGAEYNRIGTNGDGISDAAEANIISGNSDFGIRIDSPANVIYGNYIGTDSTGTADLGNGTHGILINNNALGVAIGGSPEKANTIAFNNRAGIYVRKIFPTDPIPDKVIITFNSIYSNHEEGIDLDDGNHTGSTPNDSGDVDTGPNNFMNYPELSYASSIMTSVAITGEIFDGLPNAQFEIQFFSNSVCDSPSNHGEGKTYLDSTTQQTDGNGNVQFLVSLPVVVIPGSFITSTATTLGRTSEFSGCVEVIDSQTFSQEENLCDQFDQEEMTLVTFRVDPELLVLNLYVKNSSGFPGSEETNGNAKEWVYTAFLGDIEARKCNFQGFADRLYCDFIIPEEYLKTSQDLKVFVNLCIPPLYINENVSIFEKEPVCSSDMGDQECIAAGGTYTVGANCTCP